METNATAVRPASAKSSELVTNTPTIRKEPAKNMKPKTDWFIGRWQTDSSVTLEISKAAKGFKVRAFDKDDNEEFVVSNTTWDGKFLRFETYIRSTKYRTRNCLHLISRTKLIQELTFWETWRKCANEERKRVVKGSVRKRGRP